ncbi:MFS transporter [Micrococcus terreus]|uniref:MFS transporter n=1 Tax=Micrococcus terreus TaxID=574650 RepID=UPI0030173F6C
MTGSGSSGSTPSSRPARGDLTWLWVMVVAAILTQTSLNLLRPVTSYRLIEIGADEAAIGLATAAYAILPLFTAMWLGRSTARLPSLRGIIALGAAVMALSGVGLALGQSVLVIMVASAVLGMGHLVFTIAGQAAIGRRAPAHLMDAAFGWFTAAFSVGQMAGPLLSGLILGNTTLAESATDAGFDDRITASLWLGAGISLLAVPVMLAMRPDGGSARRRSTTDPDAVPSPEATRGTSGEGTASGTASAAGAEGRPTMLAILKVPGIPSHMFAALALLAMLDILTAFMPLVGERAGVAPFWVGVLLAVRGGFSVLSRVFLPWISRRWTRNSLILVSLLVSAVGIGLVPVALTVWQSMLLAVLFMAAGGFVLGLGQPLTMTQISQAVPYTWRGPALALRLVGNRVGQVALPALAGLVAAPLGPAAGVWFACAVLAASGVERVISGRTGPDRS